MKSHLHATEEKKDVIFFQIFIVAKIFSSFAVFVTVDSS